MKRISVVGLCIAAVFAFSAMTVSSASAAVLLHLFMECIKKKGGNYASKECTPGSKVGGTGKYELQEVSKEKLLPNSEATFMTLGKTATLYSYIPAKEAEPLAGGAVVGTVVCKSSKGLGQTVNAMLATLTITFKSCTSEGKVCTGVADKTRGNITTFLLSISPVLWVGRVLMLTYAAAAKGATEKETLERAETTPIAAFNCEGLEVVTTNDVLGTLEGAIEAATKKAHIVFNVNPKTGAQEDVFFEGEEVGPYQAFLLSTITPPGVTLPSGENANLEVKSKTAVGVFAL